MPPLRLVMNLLAVAAPATVVGLLLPQWLGVAPAFALVAAAIVFLFGVLMLEFVGRAEGDRKLREAIHALRGSQAAVRDELAGARREMMALEEALQAAATGRSEGGKAIHEVMNEVSVLKSLVERLSEADQAREVSLSQSAQPALAAVIGGRADEPPLVLQPRIADNLDDQSVLDEVRKCLRRDDLDLMLQPIVSLPQRKRRYYECFTRIRTDEGSVVKPERYIELAEEAGLITAVDNMLLFRCVQLVRKIQRENMELGFFCNISPYTLEDTDFFGDFIAFMDNNPELAPNLVFEFPLAEFKRQDLTAGRLLRRLLEFGCRLSVDQVDGFDLDPGALFDRDIRFVKLDAAAILSEEGREVFPSLKRELDRRAIDVIVEKVEDEQTLVELLDYGVDFGQGYLFGEPRLAKPAD